MAIMGRRGAYDVSNTAKATRDNIQKTLDATIEDMNDGEKMHFTRDMAITALHHIVKGDWRDAASYLRVAAKYATLATSDGKITIKIVSVE